MNIFASLTLALALGGATAAPLQDLSPMQLRGMIYHEKGTVMAVDAVTGMLRVKDDDGVISRYSAKQAKVNTAAGKTISLADISIGDEISVSLQGKYAIEVFREHKAVKR